jgi:Na+/melibiose symporter-like transporter
MVPEGIVALFDRPQFTRRQWSDYSLDYKLFFVWEVSLFAAILPSQSGAFDALSDAVLYGLALGWLAILSLIAIRNRIAENWRWPGLSASSAAYALLVGVLMVIFLFIFMHDLLPMGRHAAPMIAFAVSIGVFNILSSLKLVQNTQEEFERYRVTDESAPAHVTSDSEDDKPIDPLWKRVARGAYFALFILIWLEGMAFFYFHERFVDQGAREPSMTRTHSVNEHGTLVYLTDDQAELNGLLETLMMIGIPAIILSGFALHFVVGVPLFNNMPASRGLFGTSDD